MCHLEKTPVPFDSAADAVSVVRAEQAYHHALNELAAAARIYASVLVGRALNTIEALDVIKRLKRS